MMILTELEFTAREDFFASQPCRANLVYEELGSWRQKAPSPLQERTLFYTI